MVDNRTECTHCKFVSGIHRCFAGDAKTGKVCPIACYIKRTRGECTEFNTGENMNTETQVVIYEVANNLEYWVNFIGSGSLSGEKLRHKIMLSCPTSVTAGALFKHSIDKVDWTEVGKCIPRCGVHRGGCIHLKDAENAKDYIVSHGGNYCPVGSKVQITRYQDWIVLYVDGEEGVRFDNADIPDIWLTEKPVAECIHLKDAKEGQDYTVLQSYLAKCKNGATVRVHKCSNHIHLEIEGVVPWESFYNAGIPDVWLTEKPVVNTVKLSGSENPDGEYIVVSTEDSDFKIGEIIDVKYNSLFVDVHRSNRNKNKLYADGEIPYVKMVKSKIRHRTEVKFLTDWDEDGEYTIVSAESGDFIPGEVIRVTYATDTVTLVYNRVKHGKSCAYNYRYIRGSIPTIKLEKR